MSPFLALLLAGVVGASAQSPAAGLTRIGAAAAVKGLVNAISPGTTVGRVVQSGKPLFLNDHVTTDAAGRLQVLLLDETVFTVGPNSDMVLDEFVYDPSSDKGKVTARVTKGVFRFVTGKVARKDPASMKVNLPVGTIGIRGTIAAGQVTDQGATVILLGPGTQNNANENPGAVSVSNSGGQVNLTQPGFGTTLAQGLPPTPPADMSQQLQNILGSLGGPPPSGSHSSSSGGGSGGGGASGNQDSGGTGGTSATQASGQGTAVGGLLAGASGDIINFSNSANNTQQNTSQQTNEQTLIQTGSSIADGVSTWDQLRNAQSGMTGSYSGIGSVVCNGGSCSTNQIIPGIADTSGLSFNVSVDFTARSISGGSVSLLGIPGIGNASTSILSTPFAPLSATGNATIPLSGLNTSGDPGFFTGGPTTMSFMNRGGVAAQNMKVDLHYFNSGSNTTVTGSATGPFVPSQNVTVGP